ncbi:hypothetical protein [Pseudoalteromonas sp. Of7M-16]|uniref:phage head-tail joining protein n=1 Tax=Pseudoalteromonas sp. Of7M-16 TaxID=2917756 RepID=UPI001EF731C1|nr:hypothetical protein [Pseudoalteromonas sp. Of7M-16]MCG7551561.1 hypothetical protein [Pseudoalteromonas sp. Of7M-16]
MALSKDDLDALDEAIASGELTVKINGREVTYRSVGELMKSRRHVVSVLARKIGRKANPLRGISPSVNRGI